MAGARYLLNSQTRIETLQLPSRLKRNDRPAIADHQQDWGVNGGPKKAVRDLQEVLGVTVDGAIGGETLDAVGKQKPEFIIRAVCDRRMAFYKSLDTWDVFGRGWSARANAVLASALQMATNLPHNG